MKSWFHVSKGRVAREAHRGLDALGLWEDAYTRQGFTGGVAELYRKHVPTGWTRSEGSLREWAFDGSKIDPSDQADPAGMPVNLFYNQDIRVSVSRRSSAMPFLYRNANGDEAYFVHRGTGTFETEFGPIPYEPGDWVILPRAVTYRIVPDSPDNYFLLVETTDAIAISDFGILGRHAPFDPAILFIPDPYPEGPEDKNSSTKEWQVIVKHDDEITSFFYPFDPLDVVGWKGDVFPFKMNIRDYHSVVSDSLSLPPTTYRLFETSGVIICNILPRPAETDREASRLPPFHRNVDYDEVMFVHGGTVVGSPIPGATITFTPQGLHHGFPEEVHEATKGNWKRDEYHEMKLIMLDVRRPLKVADAAKAIARSPRPSGSAETLQAEDLAPT